MQHVLSHDLGFLIYMVMSLCIYWLGCIVAPRWAPLSLCKAKQRLSGCGLGCHLFVLIVREVIP